MILDLVRRNPRRVAIDLLLDRISAASRQRALYESFGVPDTLEGRFELAVVHLVVVLRRLRGLPPPAKDVAQDLVDAFFRGLEASLRETGVTDTGVPKRMNRLAQGFYGRAGVYDRALDSADQTGLAEALARNVFGSETPAWALARYVVESDRALSGADLARMLALGPAFPEPHAAPLERSAS